MHSINFKRLHSGRLRRLRMILLLGSMYWGDQGAFLINLTGQEWNSGTPFHAAARCKEFLASKSCDLFLINPLLSMGWLKANRRGDSWRFVAEGTES